MSKKLLLADDSVVIQKLVGLSFANEDVEIISTDNGDDAVIRAREVIPDVILADVVMPGKSGYEVCEAIKADPALAQIPVLLLTGTFEAFDEAKAEASGANGQITKPFEAQALVSRVTEVMNAPVEVPAVAEEAPPSSDLSAPADSGSDLFDANVTSLASTDPGMGSDLGGEPHSLSGVANMPPSEDDFLLDEPGESRSALFGQPGDAIAADPSEQPAASPAAVVIPDLTPTIDAPTGLTDPMVPPPLPPAASTETPENGQPEGFADPLAGFSDDFGLHENGAESTPASAMQVDTALAAGIDMGDATILVAHNDSNAATSRGDGIDSSSDSPNGPQVFAQVALASREAESGRSGVADAQEAPPSLPPSHTSPLPSPSPSPAAEANVVADLDARLAEADSSSDLTPSTDAEDFLDIGPSSMAGDDLDFAFDVSEQQQISEVEDPLDQSYSSLVDVSESQILNDPSAQSEPLAGDYDVSSSDLATAPPPFSPLPPTHEAAPWPAASDAETGDSGIPVENDPDDQLISVPDETPASAVPNAAPLSGVSAEDSFTGVSAQDSFSAPPVEDSFSAPPVEDSFPAPPVEDSFSAAPVEDSFSAPPVEDSFPAPPVEDSFSAAPVEDSYSAPPVEDSFSAPPVEDSISASPVEDSFSAAPVGESSFDSSGSDVYGGPGSEPVEFEDSRVPSDELIVGDRIVAAELRSRSTPDLSPMMEQQIQETLEKVAWEAFSDLSETIVKQVMERVEKIAWEVIPQMTETLVREEIRRMKGEDD